MNRRPYAKALAILALSVLLALSGVALQASGPSLLLAYCSGQNNNSIGTLVFDTLYQRDIVISSCAPAGAKVTKVEVTVSLDHNCSVELNVRLDNSHHSAFLQNGVCPGHYGGQVLNFTSSAYNGDPVNDTWKLFLRDVCRECSGAFNFWSIRVHYETATPTATRPPATNTPTQTRPAATSTPTPTGTRPVQSPTPTPTDTPPVRTPTATPTGTRPVQSPTPTPTITRPAQTPTPTPTRQPGCDYLSADFDWTSLCLLSFYFYDKSTTSPGDPINSWEWNFGNGHTTTLQNASWAYSAAGIYNVTLTVRTRSGCEASITKPVESVFPNWTLTKELVSPVGRPVYFGDEVTYRIVIGATSPSSIVDYDLIDVYDRRYYEFVSASPPADHVKLWYGTLMEAVWEKQGPIPAGGEREYYITLRIRDAIEPQVQNYQCNEVLAIATLAPNNCGFSTSVRACPYAGPRPSGLTLDKVLLDPPGGVANLGDAVQYEIRVHNHGVDPVTLPSIDDFFALADYDFISASPPPDVSKAVGSDWVLIWQNRTILPGDTLTMQVTLRTLRATEQALNCASYPLPPPEQPSPPGVATLAVAIDCAAVAVRPQEGKHAAVYKRFTLPSNHIAKVGDWLSFETQWLNVGTETATRLDVHDAIVPPAVSKFLPLTFGFIWPFQTGDWAKITASFKAEAPGWPAVNTADWTATWGDGSKTTTSDQDFVYIAEGDVVARGLAVRKVLTDPLGGAVPGDIATFAVMVTNTTGLMLPNVAVYDTFDPQCFDFHDASLPPDSVTPGQVTWNNVGPLGPGAAASINVRLRAKAPCGIKRNCARAEAAIPGGPTLTGVDCAQVELRGEEQPRLSLAKHRPQPGPVAVGVTFEWHLLVENTGGVPLPVIPLADLYDPVHLGYVSALPAPDSVDAAKGLLEWADVGPLQPGQQRTIVVRFEAIRPGLQVRNCAHSEYWLGSTSVPLVACDYVDIESPDPAIEVRKILQYPAVAVPGTASGALPMVGLGSTVVYTVSVRNTGGQPLSAVNVTDHFDPGCLEFLAAPGMTTARPQPGTLAWFIALLNPGEERSWTVIFRAIAPCHPATNCVDAVGRDPAGVIVADETCIAIEITPPEPGISVRKSLQRQESLPVVGDVLVYELVVQNTGNTILTTVPLWEAYDLGCLEFVGAVPSYDWHDALAGQVHWQNVGPLLPGEGRVVYVMLRAIAPCWPVANCAWSEATDVNQADVRAEDCIQVWIGEVAEEGQRLFLPITIKNLAHEP